MKIIKLAEAAKAAKAAKASYDKPTPSKWRKWGDSILGLGTLLTGISAIAGAHPALIISSAVLTWIGKTLTNLASE
jgi:hypothetical protein